MKFDNKETMLIMLGYISRYNEGTITNRQHKKLCNWIGDDGERQDLFLTLTYKEDEPDRTTIPNEREMLAALLAGYMRENLTPNELDRLHEWVGRSDKNTRLFEQITDKRAVKLALELMHSPD